VAALLAALPENDRAAFLRACSAHSAASITNARASGEPYLDLDGDGSLRIWPENRPAVEVFLLVGDQWLRAGIEGVPTAINMATVLEYAREFVRMCPNLLLLSLVADVKFLAVEVVRLLRTQRKAT